MSEPVFLKQYGERRSGTNYLRSLLTENYQNAVVLMHVLGDKHSRPVEFAPPATGSAELAYEWVRCLTHAVPAISTVPENPEQQDYMRKVALPLADAVRRGELGFLISIKDPYAWGASICAYNGWLPRGLPRALPPSSIARGPLGPLCRKLEECWACIRLARACREANEKYRAWLGLHERFAGRSTIIRYDDLLTDPSRVLDEIARKHPLRRSGSRVEAILATVLWANWDHKAAPPSKADFDPGYYRERRYLNAITHWMVSTITLATDWSLMACFGYRPIQTAGRQKL